MIPGGGLAMSTSVLDYEEQLNRNPRWAMMEGGLHFEKENKVFESLRRITKKLDELGIPYAVVGGMALFHHGYRRFTDDVDLLVTKDDLKTIHEKLEGLGWNPAFTGSKHLKDAQTGVKVEFLTTGDYPGDGKPKPVSFPDPKNSFVTIDGMNFIDLHHLVEMKLASGMSNINRMKDLTDVMEIIKFVPLPAEFVEKINPYVQHKFVELWEAANQYYPDAP
jgi:hypothetical protein